MNKRCLKVLPVLFVWTSCGPGKKQSSPGGPLALAPLVWIEASAQISLQEHLVLMPTLSRKSECVREGGTMAVTCQCHWPQKLQCFNPQKLQCFNCTNAVSHLDRPDSWTLRKQSLANTSDRLAKTYLPQWAGGTQSVRSRLWQKRADSTRGDSTPPRCEHAAAAHKATLVPAIPNGS